MQTYEDLEQIDYPNPIFKGFTFQIQESENKERLQKQVDKELKLNTPISEWSFKESSVYTNILRVTCPKSSQSALSVTQAWILAERLRNLQEILYAEPLFTIPITPLLCSSPPCPASTSEVNHLGESEKIDWSLEQINAGNAWEKFQQRHQDKLPGYDIVIGHPDTGYLLHPEIQPNLMLEKGRDFVDGDPKPIDDPNNISVELNKSSAEIKNYFNELNKDLPPFFGHGTSVASVIISPKGKPDVSSNNLSDTGVTGVAYGSMLIPIRIHSSPVLFEIYDPALARAIEYAVEQGAHVISISMGGPPSCRLRRAISYALERGVIVVAAAGNILPFVVWPAAYDDVIAVASSNAKKEISQYSSWGSQVDVTAPGESVWCATVKRKEGGDFEYLVERESGTSLAVAFVAGVAALWLSYHGRDELIETYGVEKIPAVFKKVLQKSCDKHKPNGWDTNKYGAGIVDAYEVLNESLPDKDDPDLKVTPVFDSQICDPVEHLIENARSNTELVEAVRSRVLEAKFSELIGVSDKEVPHQAKELLEKMRNALLLNEDVSPKLS